MPTTRPLLHIGYHKTGTTFLQRRVFPEPGFSLVAEGKQLGPIFTDPFDFDPQRVRESFQPAIEKALEQGLVSVLSAERLSGSPHSGGYDSKQIAKRLAQAFPEARVLIVIREQTQMLVSVYKQYVKMGGSGTFRQYATPPSEGRVPLFDLRFYEYHRLIACYQDLFGPENVLVLPYELLRARPRRFLGRIGNFAQTSAKPSKFRPTRPSPSALAITLKRHANRLFVRDDLNPAPLFDIEGINRTLLKLCYRADRKIPENLKIRSERHLHALAGELVGTRYVESNALISELTGLDLSSFGYP